MFDLNKNRKMDAWEWALLDDITRNNTDEEKQLKEQLELSGLDFDDLMDMDEDDRREVIEDANLDLDDFDAIF